MRALGHSQRVVDDVTHAIERARDLDHASAWPRLTCVVSEALLDLGQLDDAQRLASDAGTGLPSCKARLAAVRARAKILAGADPHAARAMFERTAPRGTGYAGAVRDLSHADLDLWCGDLDAALTRARAIETTASRAGWAWITCRARLVIAEVACRRADLAAALPPLEAAIADATTRGFVGELVHAELLVAVTHRIAGDTDASARSFDAAIARARRHGLGPLVGERFVRRLSLSEPIACRMHTADGVHWLTAAQTPASGSTANVVDLIRNRVVMGGEVIDLSRNASQLKLLATLAATPRQPVTIEAIVAATWGVAYQPTQHRGRVLMTISRLRKLLGASTIELGDGSYRLVLPSPWIVLEPYVTSAAAAATSAA